MTLGLVLVDVEALNSRLFIWNIYLCSDEVGLWVLEIANGATHHGEPRAISGRECQEGFITGRTAYRGSSPPRGRVVVIAVMRAVIITASLWGVSRWLRPR